MVAVMERGIRNLAAFERRAERFVSGRDGAFDFRTSIVRLREKPAPKKLAPTPCGVGT
jgi:hypothetical protein